MSVTNSTEALLAELTRDGGTGIEMFADPGWAAAEAPGIDGRTAVLIRLGALVALDAPPASYLVHLSLSDELGVCPETTAATLMALVPLVGSARVISAADKMLQAIRSAGQL